MRIRRKIQFLIAVFLASTIWCYGYIDPGTGSYLVQVIIAIAAGTALGIKLFWKKIKAFITHLFSKGSGTPKP